MTIYAKAFWRLSTKRARRAFRIQTTSERNTRASYAFYRQIKRYPNCRNVLELRYGKKTNTDIFPDGYDTTLD